MENTQLEKSAKKISAEASKILIALYKGEDIKEVERKVFEAHGEKIGLQLFIVALSYLKEKNDTEIRA